MQVLLLIGFGALLVLAITAWFAQGRRKVIAYGDVPVYQRRDSLLSRQEQAYLEALDQTVGAHARIFPKVRLAEIITYPVPHPRFRPHWQRVQRRCVDFLLCTPNSLTPVLAVKLESRADRRKRETQGVDVLDDALELAGLPLMRVPMSNEYEPGEVASEIRTTLARAQGGDATQWFVSEEDEPEEGLLTRFTREQLPTFNRWAGDLLNTVRNSSRSLVARPVNNRG